VLKDGHSPSGGWAFNVVTNFPERARNGRQALLRSSSQVRQCLGFFFHVAS